MHARGSAFVEYGRLLEIDKTLFVTASYALTRLGNEAVIVFFVLSGFLVGGRAFKRIYQGTFSPTDYAIDRFVRIMLPLLPALILTAVVSLIIKGDFSISILIGNIFSLQGVFVPVFEGNGPLWSLSYEVWFYILVFALGIASIKKEVYFPSIVLLISFASIFTVLDSTYLFCWLIGAMAYITMPSTISKKILMLSILGFIYSLLSTQFGSDSISISAGNIGKYIPSLEVSRILLSLSIAMLIQQILLIKPTNIFTKKIDQAGTTLAAFSYTLYLTHYPILGLMTYFGLERAQTITASTISIYIGIVFICLIVGWILYLLFEKHTNFIRKKIKTKIIPT